MSKSFNLTKTPNLTKKNGKTFLCCGEFSSRGKKVVQRDFSRRDFPRQSCLMVKQSCGEIYRSEIAHGEISGHHYLEESQLVSEFIIQQFSPKNSSLPIQAGKKRDLIIRFNYLIIRYFIIRESFSNNSFSPIGDSRAQ